MRRNLFLAVAAVFCWFQAFIPANAQDAKLLALLDSKNKQIDGAMIRGDMTPVMDLISPVVTITNPVGAFLTREDLARAVKSGELRYTSMQDSEEKLAQFGDVAVLTFVSVQAGTEQGHDISGKFRFTEVWARQAGAWKLVAVQLTQVMPPQ
jgi:hypothetical protein